MRDLEDRLRALSAEARWPQTPELAGWVTAAIRDGRRPRRFGRRSRSGGLLAILLVGGLAAAPGVRSELLERLGLRHATVTRVTELPPTTLGRTLALGTRVPLATARDRAGFELRRPAQLGSPDAVYLQAGAVTFTYEGTRPIVFIQVRGTVEPFVRKLAQRTKRVDIAGAPGLLVEGPHVVIFQPPRGTIRESPSRLSATTVLWERDGLLMRLEGERPARELLELARSVRSG